MEESNKPKKQQTFTFERTVELIDEMLSVRPIKLFDDVYRNPVVQKKIWRGVRERLKSLSESTTVEGVRLKYNCLLEKYCSEIKNSKISGSGGRDWLYLKKFTI